MSKPIVMYFYIDVSPNREDIDPIFHLYQPESSSKREYNKKNLNMKNHLQIGRVPTI